MSRFGMHVRLAYPEGYGLIPEVEERAARQAGNMLAATAIAVAAAMPGTRPQTALAKRNAPVGASRGQTSDAGTALRHRRRIREADPAPG